MMASVQDFRPDWASAPGETIVDILQEQGLSTVEFAQLMDQSLKETTDLLESRTAITLRLARKLHSVVGASPEFWINRDYQYREEVKRLDQSDTGWLSELPLSDMINFGWLNPKPKPSEEMTACLNFFGVATLTAWRAVYSNIQTNHLFRTSTSFESRTASVAAWLRESELRAETISCAKWNAELFGDKIVEIRKLTRLKEPKIFLPQLQEMCSECGVAVVVVPLPNGCRASGAAKLLSEEKAMITLSFRYLSDDHVWFTFFHEAAHLLLHAGKGIFIDGLESSEGLITQEEEEANSFAANILIPPNMKNTMLALPSRMKEVVSFARKCGVSPGIVVGQLQHLGKLRRNQLNTLKRRYEWNENA